MEFALWIALFAVSVVIHEVSHGAVAYFLGDDTAKRSGRLTLNPLRHIDPFWTVIFPTLLYFSTKGNFIFAMAKPVPVNFSRLSEPKKDMGLVAAAGPLSNVFLAECFAIAWKFTGAEFLLYGVYLNLGLAVFNMVPIPPLDGSRVLASILPGPWAYRYLRIERFGYLILFALYFSRVLTPGLIFVINSLCGLIGVPLLT